MARDIQKRFYELFGARIFVNQVNDELIKHIVVYWDERGQREICRLINPSLLGIKGLLRLSVERKKNFLLEIMQRSIIKTEFQSKMISEDLEMQRGVEGEYNEATSVANVGKMLVGTKSSSLQAAEAAMASPKASQKAGALQ